MSGAACKIIICGNEAAAMANSAKQSRKDLEKDPELLDRFVKASEQYVAEVSQIFAVLTDD
jgi:hypothetical protein